MQEILTVKSDDVIGRVKTYEAIIKGENIPDSGIPESFKVLLKELQSLGLDVRVMKDDNTEVEIVDTSEYSGSTDLNSVLMDDKNYAFESGESFSAHGYSQQEFNSDSEQLETVEEGEEFAESFASDSDYDVVSEDE